MAEKFCLKWNDFQTNVSNTFRKLRTSDHFYDVTLVSDDQQQMSAHKVVLSSSSEYFKNVLTSNSHSHPMLCLSGVSKGDLQNIMDFIYNGEIQIYQEDLDQFLNIAQRFKLDGLIQGKEENISTAENKHDLFVDKSFQEDDSNMVAVHEYVNDITKMSKKERIISVHSANFENIEELDQKIDEMMERQQDGKYKCLTCGKLQIRKGHMTEHVEIHIDGLSFPCHYCDKTFRSRSVLRDHIRKTCNKR